MDYKEKNVWIIGASSGIGLALAHELARRGARLALSARRQDALDNLKNELGTIHVVFPLDVTDASAFIKIAVDVKDTLGQLDCVINLSAIYTPSSLANMNLVDARNIIDVNLMGTINTLQAVLPVLRAQGGGQIALCGSVAGYRGLPNAQPYAATKAAVINLAETARLEESKSGVDVRVINPGFVRTPMTDKNSFSMPMMISPEEAAQSIADGLLASSFEVHFPKIFTWIMKIVKIIPNRLYFRLFRR